MPIHYLLMFDPVMQLIATGLNQLPPYVRFHIEPQEYIVHLLEWLSVKIEDDQATSAADLAVAYLEGKGVEPLFAREMSHVVMDSILNLVHSTFPKITFQELSAARYVLTDNYTLNVYITHREWGT